MTHDTVIVGSHVVLPTGIIDKNIVLDEGKIIGFTNDIPSSDRKINADGLVAIPGVIDTHVHYGVYSPIEYAAVSESHAAAIGGITTMMRMLRRGDSYKNSLSPQLNASSKSHYIDYAIHASIFNTQQVDEMQYCVENGVTSFKLYMNLGGEVGHVYMDMEPGKNLLQEERVEVTSEIVEKVVKNSSSLGCPVLVHAEDYEECGCGIKKAKEKNQDGLSAWSESRPTKSEAKSIQTIAKFARDSNCTIYFAHIGSQNALEQISEERKNGTKIFVETCPHYLTLSHENQEGYLAKVMPPIRSQSDVLSVWNAINQNSVNTIGTDHVANQIKLKLDGNTVWDALAGFPGIGTLLPLMLSEGVNKNKITISQLVNLTSMNAAKIFGMYPTKGSLEINSDADITLIDLKKEQKVTTELFGGFSDYIVYDGWELKGWPVKTIVRGQIIAEDFQVIGKPGYGKLVPRKINST
ncbi:MAG: dihydroorotase [Thaumarchaeota archaeon]|jgi:dihydropyrimidinase|nr:dihydroorotase [Nitrososphaerota archaeon]|tara:strand:+ start:1134 stop:2531 length:1398 start_codon:yes stop_codon:yes gene_type:complete